MKLRQPATNEISNAKAKRRKDFFVLYKGKAGKMTLTLLFAMAGAFLIGLAGCVGPQVTPEEAKGPDLNIWLEKEGFPAIIHELSTSSFFKGRPFIVVRARSEQISREIDKLTEDVRERLESRLLEHAGILLVRKHPAPLIDRPYTFQDIRCNYQEYSLLLTIDIKAREAQEDRARINIRAIDRKKDTWVQGFSVHKEVSITPQQNQELAALGPDTSLRGLKYLPFTGSQKDDMAAYLVRNLSCIFKQAYGGSDVKVFVDPSRTGQNSQDVLWFVKKQLHFCNEIQLINQRDRADWILVADYKEVGTQTPLAQFWVEALKREGGTLMKGMATYAYFIPEEARNKLSDALEEGNEKSRNLSPRTSRPMLTENQGPHAGYRNRMDLDTAGTGSECDEEAFAANGFWRGLPDGDYIEFKFRPEKSQAFKAVRVQKTRHLIYPMCVRIWSEQELLAKDIKTFLKNNERTRAVRKWKLPDGDGGDNKTYLVLKIFVES